jgi:cytosine/creatinine deaminase
MFLPRVFGTGIVRKQRPSGNSVDARGGIQVTRGMSHIGDRRIIAPMGEPDFTVMLSVALEEARLGLEEGGIPIGAALFDRRGTLLGRGHNRRVQDDDPSVHAETDAFRKAGRRRSYRDTVMATTLAPCWYCSGLILQFGIGAVVVGESRTFRGGIDWLRQRGVAVIDLDSVQCAKLLTGYIGRHPEVWHEDIGED